MTVVSLGVWLCAVGFVVVFGGGAVLLWWLGDDEKPMEDVTVVNKLHRIVQTQPGDTLRDGIRRAFVLSHEYGAVCLLHQGVPVMVSEFSTPDEATKKWTETGKLYSRGEICSGK
jgi:hypothetical protein